MHFFVTGHTGFKGSWLIQLLLAKGYKVSGYSLDPLPGSLFEICNLAKHCVNDYRHDIRDFHRVVTAIKECEPDVVIHMAAQPLVRESYRNPVETFETNVDGTLNLLRACQEIDSIRAQLIVTTDKVYKNKNQKTGYKEDDELGGQDPYSASKSMADILTQSWISSVKCAPTAIARAGNVIGGGDVSVDRLIPDLINAYKNEEIPKLRFPGAVRPWQYVLDCLNGYLKLVEYLLSGGKDPLWNFGPKADEFKEVSEVAEIVARRWDAKTAWEYDQVENPHEANLLSLDSSKAREILGWEAKYDFKTSVALTSKWYEDVFRNKSNPKEITDRAVNDFLGGEAWGQ